METGIVSCAVRTRTAQAVRQFEDIYNETKVVVLQYIVTHLNDLSEAEDVFQNVYENLYTRIEHKGACDIREPMAFLITSAKREISRHNKRRKRAGEVAKDDGAYALYEETPDPSRPFEEIVSDRAVLERIRTVITQMPPATRKVFMLYYYFDLPIAAIAEDLGTTVDAVKSRLLRARNRIRLELADEGEKA